MALSRKKRNLERIDRDIHAGAWRISALLDPITEKKFRLFSLKTRTPASFSLAVLTHRCNGARMIADGCCPAVLSLSSESDRVDILTQWFDLVPMERLGESELAACFDALLRTLALFDRHSFFATELLPEAIGRTETGDWALLPPAYAVPLPVDTRAVSPGRRAAQMRTSALAVSFEHPEAAQRRGHHATLIGEFVSRFCQPVPAPTVREGSSSFRARLSQTAHSIARGDLAPACEIYETLFGTRLDERFRPAALGHEESGAETPVRDHVDRILARVTEEGSVTVLEGPSHSGKTRIMAETARLLRERGEFEVFVLDEWDLYARTRTRLAPAGRPTPGGKQTASAVWLIDDIDDKALASSEFSRSMIESESFPRGAAVLSVQSEGSSKQTADFLGKLEAQRGARCERIALGDAGESRSDRFIGTVVDRLDTAKTRSLAGEETEGVDDLLSSLSEEERQLFEFIAVARFAVPVEVVLSVFPETEDRIAYVTQRLTSCGLIDQRYRQPAQRSDYTLFLSVTSAGMRRMVHDRVPPQRRRTLHRTLVLAAEETGDYPAHFLLYHCLRAQDATLAARHLVKYLKETRSEKRDPFVVSIYAELSEERIIQSLAFADRVLACYELSQDLFKAGKAGEAEQLLLTCAELMESVEIDQKLKSATLLSSSLRLLADWWEKRGEYKRALELLDSAKFELQSALSIPDQARLLNDIGWLQYRLGDYEASMESSRLSLNTLNPNQHPLIVAHALNLMGVVHYNSSRYDEAISYYEQSAMLRERAGDENATAASYNNLALAYQAKAEYEKALDYYNRSLKLKRRQNNSSGIAAGYLNLALLYLDMRNFKEAEARCRESLAVCEMLDEVHAQALPGNYMTLGDIAVEQGDLDTAYGYYRQSLGVARRMGAINEEMGAYRRLSSTALRGNRFEEARSYAEKALDLVQRIGSKYENAQLEEILGDLELKQDRQTDALKHYEKSAGQYTAMSKYRLALKVLSKIGLIHAESGNSFEARHCLDRAEDYVRADIGHELPEEYSRLQRLLRGRVSESQPDASEAQRITTAFYEMSALTDSARDSREFFAKLSDAVKEIASPDNLLIALKTEGDRFVTVDASGIRRPLEDKVLILLFKKTLSLGVLIDDRSADVSDVLPDLKIPADGAFVSIPLKAMNEDIGCLLLYIDKRRFPFSKRDANFFIWFGRQVAANLALMLHLNEGFLRDYASESPGEEPPAGVEPRQRLVNLIGKSEPMRKVFRTIEKIQDADSGILILGESGTGKSVLARAIHSSSPRRKRPFREIHCAQIPYNLLESELFGHERGAFTGATHRKVGLCETANGGTLFLDDINVVPNEIQAKLLRFIENKTFTRLGGTTDLIADVRIIAASNEDLEALCREGRFREDLYFRLKVILIDLPPLRERPEDTIAIALDYLKRSCADKQIPLKTLSPETIQLLQKAPWRGNVRELQNVLERVVVLSDDTIITPESLPEDFLKEASGTSKQSQRQLDELVEEIIKLGGYSQAAPLLPMLEALIVKCMVDHAMGKGQAAQLLGISKPTLYARLRDYEKFR